VTISIAIIVSVRVVVGSVDLEPRECVLLVLEIEAYFTLLNGHVLEDVDDVPQAVGIKCCVMLLRQTKGSLLPVGHLLTLAHLKVQQMLGHLGQT